MFKRPSKDMSNSIYINLGRGRSFVFVTVNVSYSRFQITFQDIPKFLQSSEFVAKFKSSSQNSQAGL